MENTIHVLIYLILSYFAIKTEIIKIDLSNDLICDADKIENYD